MPVVSRSICAKSRSMSVWTVGSSTPAAASKTTWPDWPVRAPNPDSARRSRACWLSAPGIENSVFDSPPAAPASANSPTTTSNQAPTTSRRWRYEIRAMWASTPTPFVGGNEGCPRYRPGAPLDTLGHRPSSRSDALVRAGGRRQQQCDHHKRQRDHVTVGSERVAALERALRDAERERAHEGDRDGAEPGREHCGERREHDEAEVRGRHADVGQDEQRGE